MAANSHRSRRRRSREEIGRLITDFRASGLSQRRFALSRGVNPVTLGYWLRQGQRSPTEPDSGHALVPVRVREGRYPSWSQSPVIEVVLRNGRTLRVPLELEEARLARLVELLDSSC